ncbi:MAG: DUF4437 domain-containing protein [Acidobacteria bacterium]|nr:DUF4437 domain-containing protein [Acidobacteriota bacterium]
MARPHIEPFVDRDVPFKRMTLPGFPRGMNYKMLSIDRDNGACTMTVQFDGGYKQPPGFSYSDVEILVMEGLLQVGDRTCGPGYYFFVPARVHLPAMSTSRGCLALFMYNQREPNFVESDQDGDRADRSDLVQVSTYDDMPWMTPTLHPATAPGCLLKLLRIDEKTHAMSFLYCMVPGFWQDNISYHDVAEECYHIWGTSWMMQFGDLPTGGYFWRPPFINHGAFASEYGILGFGRTDGELYNHFHFHPWSTPEENKERAAARLLRRKPELYRWIEMHGHNHPTDFDFSGR